MIQRFSAYPVKLQDCRRFQRKDFSRKCLRVLLVHPATTKSTKLQANDDNKFRFRFDIIKNLQLDNTDTVWLIMLKNKIVSE